MDNTWPGAELIDALSSDLLHALDAVQVPAYIVDIDRRLRWQNAASIRLVGDLRGKLDRSIVVAEDLPHVREAFARKQLGALHTELEVTVIRSDGTRVRVAVSSVPLRGVGGEMIGSFGITRALDVEVRANEETPRLTARQHQTLALLAAGCSTAQMAEIMGLSPHTVRNHVKALLRSLDARSRVDAVAKGRLADLV
jgi:DNA-binding CsgD family transcriptional regulator